MERCLSLVLDEMGNISLTLEKMEARELDKFIIKNFNSSEEIRKKYAAKIESYLEQRKAFITKVEIYNDKRYAGSIVITELQNDLSIKKKKVLYKKDMIIFKEITKNKKFISALQERDYINFHSAVKEHKPYERIFSDAYSREIKFHCHSVNKFNRVMGQWRNLIKDFDRYYEIVRVVLKEYKNRYKELGLDSPDVVYSKYLTAKQESLKEKEEADRIFAEQSKTLDKIEQPTRYVSGADEEEYPGDLEKNDNSQVSTEELEEGMSNGKTKTLNNGHHKLFDFNN